jgi:hypothetical protein
VPDDAKILDDAATRALDHRPLGMSGHFLDRYPAGEAGFGDFVIVGAEIYDGSASAYGQVSVVDR